MSNLCYVQRRNHDWASINCASAAYGFQQRGWEVVPFTREQVHSIKITADTVVVAEISTTKHALREAGYLAPEPVGMPEVLKPFLLRASWESTLGEIRDHFLSGVDEDGPPPTPLFIKPRDVQKAFTGHVARVSADLIETSILSSDLAVIVQDVVEFISEWRVFVQNGKILHIARYKGDPLKFADPYQALQVIRVWGNDAPAAYGIDIGLTENHSGYDPHTALVEVNDGYALGSYGMESSAYSTFLETRWRELTNDRRRLPTVSSQRPADAPSGDHTGRNEFND